MKTVLYPGVKETLEKIIQTKIMLTNKPEIISREITNIFGITHHFREIIGGDTFPRKKPDPFAINLMLERYGVDRAKALMIGDTATDVETAQNAGIEYLTVSYGYALPGELNHTNGRIHNFTDLLPILNG
jgi:phosphoglycolate phosphatase